MGDSVSPTPIFYSCCIVTLPHLTPFPRYRQFLVERNDVKPNSSARWHLLRMLITDSNRPTTTSYSCLIITFAPSRTVSEIYAIFTNRKLYYVDFSARWRH